MSEAPSPGPITGPTQPEVVRRLEGFIRVLNPENPQDFAMGRAADIASLEAYNPDDSTHDAMTDKQLTRWLGGDSRHMTRFLIVDSRDYGNYVDLEMFNRTIEAAREAGDSLMAGSLEKMRESGIVGFTYLYNDASWDADFRRRAQVVRNKQGLPGNHSVSEMNFWFVPGTQDGPVEQATRDTLQEFGHTRPSETTTVMFADAGDVREAYEEATGETLRLKDIARKPDVLGQATEAFQDSRILQKIGFSFIDRIRYDKQARFLDFAYSLLIPKGGVKL